MNISLHLDGLVGARVETLPRNDESSYPMVLSGKFLYQTFCFYIPNLVEGEKLLYSAHPHTHTGSNLNALKRSTVQSILSQCDGTDWILMCSNGTDHLCVLNVPHLNVMVH